MRYPSVWRATLVLLAAAGLASAGERPDVSKLEARPLAPAVRDAVAYEVFPRAFSAKGDLNGVTARLDELRDLGATLVWLMPVHEISAAKRKGTLGSPYAARDYDSIDPGLGTSADLKRLVREAHARGLRVILDVALNHTGWDNVLMEKPSFYTHDAQGRVVSPLPDWADVADLNYDEPELRVHMTRLLVRWMTEFDLDGFRCDVAFMVPTDFWERARQALEAVKPDVILLAEAAEPELLVKAFDFDYAWPFHAALSDVLQGRAPASTLREVWEREQARFPRGARHMLFSDNHDERRALARFGEGGALVASALVFGLPGVPMIYNGMEVGDTTESGAPALFERLPIFWSIAERRPQFRPFYQALTALRRQHPALREGDLVWLRNSEETRVLTFARRSGGEEVVLAFNLSSRPFVGTVEVAGAAGLEEITPAAARLVQGDAVAALPALSLDAWAFRVFRRAP
jgi:glycosidase